MEAFSNVQDPINTLTIAAGFAVLFVAYQLGVVVYRLYLHPMSKVPGPWYTAVSRIPYSRHMLAGTTGPYLQDLHAKYGDVVRYSPNEISVTSGETAWQDIYGFRVGRSKGTGQFPKDPVWYPPPANGVPSMLIAGDAAHGRQRRTVSHAFSDRALKDQEVLLQRYVDLLVNRLKEVNPKSPVVNLAEWLNWTTFDIIADLCFGKPFGCLQNLETHEYVRLLLDSVRGGALFYIVTYFPWVKKLGSLVIPKEMMARRIQFSKWVYAQTEERCAQETQRPDFMTHILAHKDGDNVKTGISQKEINSNAVLMLTAGTETTATAMAAATFLLLKNPDTMDKLKKEIRGRFQKHEDINVDAVSQLEYPLAVIHEALRFMPPVAAGFVRKVPKGGETVSGRFIPSENGETSISVTQLATYKSSRNFKDPEKFAPERWLGDERYKDDNRAAFQPFSYGPRNCLGKNLAYAEMRLILAKLVFNFDMELQEESKAWMTNMKIMLLWQKPPMMVKLTPVA